MRDTGSGYGDEAVGAAAARRFASRIAQSPRAHSITLLEGRHRSMLAPDSDSDRDAMAMDLERPPVKLARAVSDPNPAASPNSRN